MNPRYIRVPATLASMAALSGLASAQFQIQQVFPTGGTLNGSSESVDFADVDLDGDWDAGIADGGDDGNDQNRLLINRGGLQGGEIGTFADETDTRLPAVPDDSRDIEFVDIDNDGDVDIYVSNTAQISNQGAKWWTNNGLAQGGTLGFYTDSTAERWVDLGTNGSSVPAAGVLPGNTFIDWSCDCDFADLDNDGDIDLVHSSYGGAFGGQVPTRLFLNDGTGKFKEFNPSGFQLTQVNIVNGNPALWCEGTQQASTKDASGQFADIAATPLDIDLGDLDGDFDIDILHGSRNEEPRIFFNQLEENSSLGFRDVSGAALPAGWNYGGGNYEQELGDLDSDGDLDIYGLNWSGFSDVTFINDGNGFFSVGQPSLPNSGADDNEGDFIDWNADGFMDLAVANFSGADKLYVNNGSGVLNFVNNSGFTGGNSSSLDGDAADVDNDGDTDFFVSEDNFAANIYYENITQIADVHAPYIPNTEAANNGSAQAGTEVLRAHVYDNVPYYIAWYNETTVELSVDGVVIDNLPAKSSLGQIFRVEVPANLFGDVSLTWTSSDQYGNAGSSAPVNYTRDEGGATVPFGYGGGSQTAGGSFPLLEALSIPFPGSDLYLRGIGDAATAALLVITDASSPATPIAGLGTVNVAGNIIELVQGSTDGNGDFVHKVSIPAGLGAGAQAFAQFGTFNGAGINLLATSQGLQLEVQ